MEQELKVIDKRKQPEPETAVQVQQDSPAALMMAAIQKGTDLDKLEKFMSLQERWERNEAKKAYTEAMAEFKRNAPRIDKDRHVRFDTSKGTTEYKHASLWNVTDKINAALAEHGLSASWVTVQDEKGITVTCTITHSMGHSESTSLTAAPDISGSKNPIQAIGSTISYLERYTILALTGLATQDMDTDGRIEEVEYITEEQRSRIQDYVDNYGVDVLKFLVYMGAESLEKIRRDKFNVAIAALEAKRAAKEKEKKTS